MGQGYHAANLVQQETENDNSLLLESLQHLALVATTDKQTIAQLVEANAKLTDNISKLTDKLAQALQTVATLSNSTVNKTSSRTKYGWRCDSTTHGRFLWN